MTEDEVLKQAYEALVPLSNAGSPQEREILTDDDQVAAYKAMQAIEAVLAQPKQEPVAWMTKDGRTCNNSTKRTSMHDGVSDNFCIPLYTSQPPRKPLTNEQVSDAYNAAMANRPKDASNAETRRLFVKAIEAAHGIKNLE